MYLIYVFSLNKYHTFLELIAEVLIASVVEPSTAQWVAIASKRWRLQMRWKLLDNDKIDEKIYKCKHKGNCKWNTVAIDT